MLVGLPVESVLIVRLLSTLRLAYCSMCGYTMQAWQYLEISGELQGSVVVDLTFLLFHPFNDWQ